MKARSRCLCIACCLVVAAAAAAAAVHGPTGTHAQGKQGSIPPAELSDNIHLRFSTRLQIDSVDWQHQRRRLQRHTANQTAGATVQTAWQQQQQPERSVQESVFSTDTDLSIPTDAAQPAEPAEQVAAQTKGSGYRDGLTGGRPPVQPVCSTVPGCQSCPDTATCDVCWYTYGVARFVKTENGRCRCPPGYGKWPQPNPAARDTPDWADKCLPCPPSTYSRGGAIGAAECQLCPEGKTSWGAAASCNVPVTCLQGQQPSPPPFLSCVKCPIGTWQSVLNSQLPCNPCPDGWTTQTEGAVSPAECIVPICPAGTQLVPGPVNGFVCQGCTGLDYSPGGLIEQGVTGQQGLCQQCPKGKVPNLARDDCFNFICPPPDAFRVECIASYMPPVAALTVAPGQILNNICWGYPEGAEITWYRESAYGEGYPDWGNPLTVPQVPLSIAPDSRFYPTITSFQGRTDCLCPDAPETTNCRFQDAAASSSDYAGTTVQPAPYWYVST